MSSRFSCFYRVNQVLLKDIILVDDVSFRADITQELPKHINSSFQGKVKIVRPPTRQVSEKFDPRTCEKNEQFILREIKQNFSD